MNRYAQVGSNVVKLAEELEEEKEPIEPDEDGEDDDDDGDDIEKIIIKKMSNGWLISSFYEDGDIFREVFDITGNDNGDLQAIECVVQHMGIGVEAVDE